MKLETAKLLWQQLKFQKHYANGLALQSREFFKFVCEFLGFKLGLMESN